MSGCAGRSAPKAARERCPASTTPPASDRRSASGERTGKSARWTAGFLVGIIAALPFARGQGEWASAGPRRLARPPGEPGWPKPGSKKSVSHIVGGGPRRDLAQSAHGGGEDWSADGTARVDSQGIPFRRPKPALSAPASNPDDILFGYEAPADRLWDARRCAAPTPAKPTASMAQAAGSGTPDAGTIDTSVTTGPHV